MINTTMSELTKMGGNDVTLRMAYNIVRIAIMMNGRLKNIL